MLSRAQVEAFEAMCRQHGLPVTVQRRTIYEFLSGRADHPTADQVYEGVKDRIPGVSRMTVYRVLDALARIGAIKRVCSPGASSRFDANIQRHHHLVCMHCDKLTDYANESLDRLPLPDVRSAGFDIDDYSIQYRGICSDCRAKLGRASQRRRVSHTKRKRNNDE